MNVRQTPYWKHRQRLVRMSGDSAKPEKLDPGVAYFILMLEQLGAKTLYSCEGHPNGFYITFKAPYSIARKIHDCGFFSVEIENIGRKGTKNYWSLRISYPLTDTNDRDRTLGWASLAWEKSFGNLIKE